MLSRAASQKIRPDHLDRLAVIYVRQSTLFQVRANTGSTFRQYDLVKRAADLGWTQASIQVVDQDQGQSGSSAVGRDGFQWLVAEVGLGHVGAVLSLEVSRLARSCSDWDRLLEICALTDTLVIDDEGIYDPGAHNDRLLLGFKGSMSEAELHWLKSRLQGGKRADELIWSRLSHERVLNILHSPLYAGAYVYGRTRFRSRLLPGEEPRIKGRTRRVKQEDWPIVLLDAHPGYITWDQFLHNQRQLDDNRTWRAEEHRGAIREGPSLLQGIVLCGSCGRRMSIR